MRFCLVGINDDVASRVHEGPADRVVGPDRIEDDRRFAVDVQRASDLNIAVFYDALRERDDLIECDLRRRDEFENSVRPRQLK